MYYIAKVKEHIEDEKTGKIKKVSAQYLVDAMSVTDVEAIVTKEYKGVGFDWELTVVSETKIVKVLEADDRADKGRA